MSAENRQRKLNTIAAMASYVPRMCGIATFTDNLCTAVSRELAGNGRISVVAMDDIDGGYDYPERVAFQVRDRNVADYLRAAEFVNLHQYDVVNLQHEYGIFGGSSGRYVLRLIENLRMPVLTTVHTILKEPSEEQREITVEIARHSERLVVMSRRGAEMLEEIYDVSPGKITYIPHGIPDFGFVDPSFHKDTFNMADRKVILSFGLLGPAKGYELMIEAMAEIVEAHPEALYVILGATHPHVKKESGESYRQELKQLATELDVREQVEFRDEFVSEEELKRYLSLADIYVTPYPSKEQITSGTLAYALGAGKAVVSTPYWYAQELLADGRGRLTPFDDAGALAAEIVDLLSNDVERNRMRKQAYQYGRSMVWREVAAAYVDLAHEVIEERFRSPKPRYGQEVDLELVETIPDDLPAPNLSHLKVLTDDTGIVQHAYYSIPDRRHGYAIDDNARALIATSMYYALRWDREVIPLSQKYLAFLSHAFNRHLGRFRNFMAADRRWLEEAGSEDAHGRTLWALGVALRYAPNQTIHDMATRLFIAALDIVGTFTSPRAWAFTLIGLDGYLEVYGGDTRARQTRELLADRLHRLLRENAGEDWIWFEDVVTYSNARLPQALLLSGHATGNEEMLQTGLQTLNWLLEQQTAPEGHLTVIGSDGWLERGRERANFDQQPVEAMGLVEACIDAFRLAGGTHWLDEAKRCLNWFLGKNDLRLPLVVLKTGACSDALQPHGVNPNQGAESALAWLISLLRMIEIAEEKNRIIAAE